MTMLLRNLCYNDGCHNEVDLYLCRENKYTDQLRGYRAADLRLCFCKCKNQVFSGCSSYSLKLASVVDKVILAWPETPK